MLAVQAAAAATNTMDPTLVPVLSWNAAFAAVSQQQHTVQQQQQHSLGPAQLAWLQHDQQQAAIVGGGMMCDMHSVMATEQQRLQPGQQPQRYGMMGCTVQQQQPGG
jgi:hypothetical protein